MAPFACADSIPALLKDLFQSTDFHNSPAFFRSKWTQAVHLWRQRGCQFLRVNGSGEVSRLFGEVDAGCYVLWTHYWRKLLKRWVCSKCLIFELSCMHLLLQKITVKGDKFSCSSLLINKRNQAVFIEETLHRPLFQEYLLYHFNYAISLTINIYRCYLYAYNTSEKHDRRWSSDIIYEEGLTKLT